MPDASVIFRFLFDRLFGFVADAPPVVVPLFFERAVRRATVVVVLVGPAVAFFSAKALTLDEERREAIVTGFGKVNDGG